MERRSKDGTGSGDLKTEETKGQWLEQNDYRRMIRMVQDNGCQ